MPLYIAYGDPSALRARCEIATVRTTRPEETAYEPGALIPAGQWRPMTEVDVKAVTAPRRPLDSTLVEVVRPPYREGLPLEALTDPLGDPDAVYLGQAFAKAEMTTTTDNYEDGLLIGLHLDNWDKLPYGQASTPDAAGSASTSAPECGTSFSVPSTPKRSAEPSTPTTTPTATRTPRTTATTSPAAAPSASSEYA